MKVYPDANIYITYLLGQKGEALAVKFFTQGLECRFSIVASNTMFAEVAQRCEGNGLMLLQKNVDEFKGANKLEIIEKTPEELKEAVETAVKLGESLGRNDVLHTILAKRCADVFVTNDRNLLKFAQKSQNAMSLKEFVGSEP